MHIIVALAALGSLVVVLYPLVSKRLRAARRGRAVHLDESCHWYANYDEALRYEPRSRSDIVRLTRSEVLGRGYKPCDDVQIVPRTFRHRVPGDTTIRLWKSDRVELPPIWLCEWAFDPIRVSIGERERVPGVASGPLEIYCREAEDSAPTQTEPHESWPVVPDDAGRPDGEEAEEPTGWDELERARDADGDAVARALQDDKAPPALGEGGESEPSGEEAAAPRPDVRRRKSRRRR